MGRRNIGEVLVMVFEADGIRARDAPRVIRELTSADYYGYNGPYHNLLDLV